MFFLAKEEETHEQSIKNGMMAVTLHIYALDVEQGREGEIQ